MKIGFYLKWPKGQSSLSGYNVLGDELYAEAMKHELLRHEDIESVELFYPNVPPADKQDVIIYLNDTIPHQNWAKRHLLYLQNGYGEGSDRALATLHKNNYDGYAFISHSLLDIHLKEGYSGIFLPFGVDISQFYPRNKVDKYCFDVAYIGNDIKGEERTTRYLLPAVKYNFGLYGNWRNPEPRLRRRLQFWRPLDKVPEYRKLFFQLSKGKIPQEEVPFLYSSACINLNCTLQDCVNWDVITLRTLEVLACKGFLITDKVPITEKTMPDCMVFTDGDEDLSDKIDYYLNHPEERDRYAQKGYEFVKEHATLGSRMKKLLLYLEELL